MLKVALIGAGKVAESFHLPAWKQVPGAEVIALCDPQEAAARALATAFNISKTYSSLSDLLKEMKPDLVDICTPNASHFEIAKLAIENGVSTLIEKPLTVRSKDAAELIALAQNKKVTLMCAQHQRFREPSRVAKKLIQDGTLGEVYCIRAEGLKFRSVPTQNQSFTLQKNGGGPLFDLGAHLLDLSMWFMDFPKVQSIEGTCFSPLQKIDSVKKENPAGPWTQMDVEESAFAHIQLEGNRLITCAVSYLLNVPENTFRCEILGTKGRLLWPSLELFTRTGEGWKNTFVNHSETIPASVAELRHFVECVQKNTAPLIPPEESLKVIEIIEHIHKAAERS